MNRNRIIGISGAIAKEMLTMLAASIVLLAMAEGINWACFFASKEK